MTARQEPTERELLAQRLLQHLHPTDGRGVVDLLAIAGLPSGRGLAQSATIALNDLAAKGLARKEKPYGRIPLYFAVAAPVTAPEERVELPDLDAALTVTAVTLRPVGAPSDRTTLSITAALGPSWPDGTRVPGWSTSLFAAQVAAGGLAGAKAAGLARLTEMLTTLRYASPTRNFLPPPEVPVTDRDTISDLLAYCAGVSGGAKDSSVHSWLKARKLTRIRAEELLEQLVHEGRLRVVERPIAGGEVVVRYLPADPSTRPAPLPVSDAPAEEPVEEEPTPEEEPVAVAGGELLTLSNAIAHADEKGAGEGGCAADHRRLAGWLRQLEESEKARAELVRERDALRAELGAGLGDALQRTADLAREVVALRQERDVLAGERNEALREVEAHKNDFARIAHLLWLPENFSADDVFIRAFEYARIARSQAPALDAVTIGEYLLDLPEGRWQVIAEARAAIAEGKALQAAGERKIAEGRARLEQLLDTPAGAPAPAPAPELVPDPIPLGPTPPPAPEAVISAPWQGDTGEARGTMRDRVLRAFFAAPQRERRAGDLAVELEVERHAVTAPLSQLTTSGKLERTGYGIYRLARKLARRAA
jgi:hypothetical protein